jgi:hypothetical protein
MAKKKARELIKNYEDKELSSGVMVRIRPFPPGLFESINTQAFRLYPNPVPPKKIIKVVDGEEEIDDVNNPEYLKTMQEIERKRSNLLGEAVLDLCIEVLDFDQYENVIKRLQRYSGDFPEDKDERRLKFLTDFALRTKGDYEIVMVSATTQTMVDDPEVRERIEFFRGQVARATDNGADASGSDEAERLDMESTPEGTVSS